MQSSPPPANSNPPDADLLSKGLAYLREHKEDILKIYSKILSKASNEPENARESALQYYDGLLRRLEHPTTSISSNQQLKESIRNSLRRGTSIEQIIAFAENARSGLLSYLDNVPSDRLAPSARDFLVRRIKNMVDHYIVNLRMIAINEVLEEKNKRP
jgi:hypothetical protein